MEVVFAPKAIVHLKYWKQTGNKAIQNKIQQLIVAIQEIHLKVLESQSH
jgi:toxin YoeB